MSSSEPPLQAEPGRRVAVTGASGFVGRHLVRELVVQGLQPRILTRRDPVVREWRDIEIEVVPGELGDAAALRRLVAGADAVIHLAGLIKAASTAQFMAVNRDGTRAVAEAVRQHAPNAHFLQVSSLAAREPQLSGYAASKRAGETVALDLLGATASVLRPPAVYGPGDRETLIFFQLAAQRTVWLPGGPAARTALIHVADLAAALARMATAPASGRVQSTADARPAGYSWREILESAARAGGNTAAKFRNAPRLPLQALAFAGDTARRFGYAKMLTSEKLRELLHPDWAVAPQELARIPGWQPRFDLDRGFHDAVAWYRKAGWLSAA